MRMTEKELENRLLEVPTECHSLIRDIYNSYMCEMSPTLDEEWDDWEDYQALAILLRNEIIFSNSIWFEKTRKYYITLYVLCNDLFAWGMADAEDFSDGDVEDIYKLYKEYGKIGVMKWCCVHRGSQPQEPMVTQLKHKGLWDEQLENLPENFQTKAYREAKENK